MSRYCGKCGKEVIDGATFCPSCGSSVDNNLNIKKQKQKAVNTIYNEPKIKEPKVKKKMSKGKKAKLILIAILIVVIALIATILSLFFAGSSYEIYKNMKSQEYSHALTEYNNNASDDLVQKLFLKVVLRNSDEEIVQLFNDNRIDYDTACDGLNALKQMGFSGIDDLIKQISELNDSNTAIDKGNDYYEDGDYENAIKEYVKISDKDKNYDNIQTKLKDIYPKYISDIITEAKELSSYGNYAQAVSLINTAMKIIPEDIDKSSLTTTNAEILNDYKTKVINNVTTLINEKKFIEAIELINESIDIDDNEDFKKAKTEAVEKYVENVTAIVQRDLDNDDYITASRTVQNALEFLPDNSSIKSLQEKVRKETPTYFLDVVKPYATSEYYDEYINGETFKMGGKEYTNGFTLDANGSYAIFNMEGKYSSITCYIGHCDDTDMNDAELKIYCDGVLKTTKKITADALPQKINVEITGVKQLKFEMSGYWDSYYGFGNIIVK